MISTAISDQLASVRAQPIDVSLYFQLFDEIRPDLSVPLDANVLASAALPGSSPPCEVNWIFGLLSNVATNRVRNRLDTGANANAIIATYF
jgi:hypothetical protein